MSKPLEYSNNEIYHNQYRRLLSYGIGEFGEDAEMFGDSLAELIAETSNGRSRSFKREAVSQLEDLLAQNDTTLDRISSALIVIDPTADIDEYRPGWGFYPSLRAFWTDVLHHLQADLAKPARDDDY